MNGLGNDFIIFDVMDDNTLLLDDISKNMWRNIADRDNPATKGCDQILILRPPLSKGDCFMDILNADGSQASPAATARVLWPLILRNTKVRPTQ